MIKKIKTRLESDTHFTELLKGSAGAFVFRLLGMLLGYVFLLIIAREYGAEGSGIFALTLTYISIGVLLAKGGIDIVTMRNISKHNITNSPNLIKGHYLQGLSLILLFSLFVSFLFSFLSPAVANTILDKNHLSNIFFWSAFAITLLALIHFHAESLRGLKLVSFYSFLMITSVYFFATLFTLSNFQFNITGLKYIDSFLAAHIVTLLVGIILWIKYSNFFKHSYKIVETKRHLVKSSLPIMITNSSILLMGWIDIIMLGIYTSEEDVGIYNIALKLATVTTLSLIAINSIVAPKISRMYAENDKLKMEKFIHQATKLTFISAFPIVTIYLFFAESILNVFGNEFILGATALIILTIGQFINATSGPVGHILNMTNRQTVLTKIAMCAAAMNMLLNFALIPKYGIEGAAISTAISMSFWNIACVIYIYFKMEIFVFYIPGLNSKK